MSGFQQKTQPRILCLAKLSFKSEGEIKTFLEKQKLREFGITTPGLQKNPPKNKQTKCSREPCRGEWKGEEIKITVKVNTRAIIKASVIIVTILFSYMI